MPCVEAAFLRAAAIHDFAAGTNDRAAKFVDGLGKSELAFGVDQFAGRLATRAGGGPCSLSPMGRWPSAERRGETPPLLTAHWGTVGAGSRVPVAVAEQVWVGTTGCVGVGSQRRISELGSRN